MNGLAEYLWLTAFHEITLKLSSEVAVSLAGSIGVGCSHSSSFKWLLAGLRRSTSMINHMVAVRLQFFVL